MRPDLDQEANVWKSSLCLTSLPAFPPSLPSSPSTRTPPIGGALVVRKFDDERPGGSFYGLAFVQLFDGAQGGGFVHELEEGAALGFPLKRGGRKGGYECFCWWRQEFQNFRDALLPCFLCFPHRINTDTFHPSTLPSLPPSLFPYLGRADDVNLFYLPVGGEERLEHGVIHGLGEHTHKQLAFSLRVHIGGADLEGEEDENGGRGVCVCE